MAAVHDASYYAEIVGQDLDRPLRTDDSVVVAESFARAQVNAALAIAAALDRLASAIELRD
jgi:hypothetical protein